MEWGEVYRISIAPSVLAPPRRGDILVAAKTQHVKKAHRAGIFTIREGDNVGPDGPMV
jgi:hypothetical protein